MLVCIVEMRHGIMSILKVGSSLVCESIDITYELRETQIIRCVCSSRNLKGESGLFLTSLLTLWGGGNFDGHTYLEARYCTFGFGVICGSYRCCVFTAR